jgi:hypothetical protein
VSSPAQTYLRNIKALPTVLDASCNIIAIPTDINPNTLKESNRITSRHTASTDVLQIARSDKFRIAQNLQLDSFRGIQEAERSIKSIAP